MTFADQLADHPYHVEAVELDDDGWVVIAYTDPAEARHPHVTLHRQLRVHSRLPDLGVALTELRAAAEAIGQAPYDAEGTEVPGRLAALEFDPAQAIVAATHLDPGVDPDAEANAVRRPMASDHPAVANIVEALRIRACQIIDLAIPQLYDVPDQVEGRFS